MHFCGQPIIDLPKGQFSITDLLALPLQNPRHTKWLFQRNPTQAKCLLKGIPVNHKIVFMSHLLQYNLLSTDL